MKLTGHRPESVYRRYAIVSEADPKEGVAKPAALHQATPEAPRKVIPLAANARQTETGTEQAESERGAFDWFVVRPRVEQGRIGGQSRNRTGDTGIFRAEEVTDEVFNLELRKFLKKFGITAQREIEKAVRRGIEAGTLSGSETLKVRARLEIEGLAPEILVGAHRDFAEVAAIERTGERASAEMQTGPSLPSTAWCSPGLATGL